MSSSSQKDSYTPPGSSSRTSIANEMLQNRYSATTQSPYQESISNFSVHTPTAAIYQDLSGPSGQGPLPPASINYSGSPSRRVLSISDRKSFHSLSKPTFGFQNQSPLICATPEPEFDHSSTATSTPRQNFPSRSISSSDDDAESSLPSTPRPSRAIAPILITDPSPDHDVPRSLSSGDGDSQPLTALETSTADTASVRSASLLPRPTDRMGTTSRSSHGMATLKPTPSVAEAHAVTPLTRVHALHSFEPTKPNELAFKKGDLIGVVNRDDKDWWRGYLRGCTGLFLESSPAQLVAEAQQDASVLSRAASFGRLFTMLRDLDPEKDDVAGNEKIQDLYRSCMTLRPSIVKLIDKYSRMRADLVLMDESFVRARTALDRLVEENLARHNEFYEQQRPAFPRAQSTNPRVDLGQGTSHASGQLQTQPQPQVQPPSQQVQQGQRPKPQTADVQPYRTQDKSRALYHLQVQPKQAEAAPQPKPGQPQIQQQPQVPHPHPQNTQRQPLIQSQSIQSQPRQSVVQHQTQAQTSHSPVETEIVTTSAKLGKSKAVHTLVSAPAQQPLQPTPMPFPAPGGSSVDATEGKPSSVADATSPLHIVSERHRTMSEASVEAVTAASNSMGP